MIAVKNQKTKGSQFELSSESSMFAKENLDRNKKSQNMICSTNVNNLMVYWFRIVFFSKN